jgi:hypothetical protein
MNKEENLKQLDLLRQKWIGHVPKNDSDPLYWKFRCDNCIAISLKRKLESWKEEIKSAAIPEKKDDLYDVAKMIFG